MITIPLTTEDLTKVRLAPSPLWETVNSFGVLLHHGRDTVHAPWAARARRTLPGTDLSPLLAAMCLEKHCPDFLSPPPYASDATFDEELERLSATPPRSCTRRSRISRARRNSSLAPFRRRKNGC